MKFRPLHDRVLIKVLDSEEKTKGGIIIPDTAKEKPQEGEVVAVGPGGRTEDGKIINPPPTPTNATKSKLYKIKTIDIALTVRSTKNFFRNIKARFQETLNDQTRKKVKTDRYLRESIVVTAHARNLGMQ